MILPHEYNKIYFFSSRQAKTTGIYQHVTGNVSHQNSQVQLIM